MKDEAIERLFNSSNPDDWRLAAILTIKKYVYKEAIQEFLDEVSKPYNIRKCLNRTGESTTEYSKVYIFVDKDAFIQIIIGNYGIWCKSLLKPVSTQYNTVIEYI